jgi:phage-related protein
MPAIGSGCHELKLIDESRTWRIVYHVDRDVIVILEVFEKKSQTTPKKIIENCKRRLQMYKS